jgi:hypothetical protein
MTEAPETGAEGQQMPGQEAAEMEVDWKAEAEKQKAFNRKLEDQNKANASKVAEYDRLVEASKSDQQRLEERATAAEGKVPALEAENLRMRVGIEKGLPAALITRLQGATQEELERDADLLIEQFGSAGSQQATTPDLRAAAGQRQVPADQSADDWLRQMAGRGR